MKILVAVLVQEPKRVSVRRMIPIRRRAAAFAGKSPQLAGVSQKMPLPVATLF
jgi:hypothetical protein